MALKLITAGSQAVSTDDAKLHLRVTGADEDDLIAAYVQAAQAHIEQALGAPLTSETWEQSFDGFPAESCFGLSDARRALQLLKQPVTAVASVVYDVDGLETTLDPADYSVDLASGRVWSPQAWPTADDVGSVRVRFTCGYTTLPAPLKAAVLLMVGDLYANREAKVTNDLAANKTVDALLFPYRMML